ncbi:MAG: hypothetical protein ACD_4C00138G0019 [uncultured bacterium (gcode 4)]|uniref:Uncharacterized protein n=1 Tax=uncultured bacterium (gcode 4) TaxID=1234023 RepID=K2GU02_9BACT|nr:MAG: hypothetical protein ACD_4C00138G0019 [uncultured bacterium (gcode 4)]
MIHSYNEEVKIKRRKNIIFWTIVFFLAWYLYLFFQGYYLNVDFNLKTPKKENLFKQFWIINIQVFPDQDDIKVNWIKYWNVSKSIFDFWKYEVNIDKKLYIPVSLNISLNKDNLFFSNTINLIKVPTYKKITEFFDEISNVWDYYLAFDKKNKLVKILDKDLNMIKTILTKDFNYIWKNYFSMGEWIYSYDFDLNTVKPLMTKDSIPKNITCKNVRLVNDDLFCYDTMVFISSIRSFWKNEKILRINSNVILTEAYIYNNSSNSNWNSFKHEDKNFIEPESVITIWDLPFYLKNWSLYHLQKQKQEKLIVPELDNIIKAQNYQDEYILIWYTKDKKQAFLISDWKRRYSWYFDSIDIKNMEISKNNWIYFFKTKNALQMYYKWWKNIIKIIDWEMLNIFDNKAFFKMDWNNYYMQLLED